MVRIHSLAILFSLASVGLASSPSLARTIPTNLDPGTTSSEYIQPTCNKCIKTTESQSANTAVFELVYYDEGYGDFNGTLELTIQLLDGTEDLLTIDDVSLADGEKAAWTLEASAEWTWDSVDQVLLDLQPE